jgi:hypothetical protein
MLCKHYETTNGCVYKDKCQFAHGAHELRSTMNVNPLLNLDHGKSNQYSICRPKQQKATEFNELQDSQMQEL